MIICKYKKVKEAAFVPHLDILRMMGMAIRRTGLSINFSDGFNPHARLFFSQPLPLGTESECEYFCADSNENAAVFMNKINTSLPNGFKILKAKNVELNPNAAALVFKADYKVELNGIALSDIDYSYIMKSNELVIDFMDKGVSKTKDVRSMVFRLSNNENTIFLTLACGNVNLRAERIVNHLLKTSSKNFDDFTYTITKTAVYDKNDTNLDSLLFG